MIRRIQISPRIVACFMAGSLLVGCSLTAGPLQSGAEHPSGGAAAQAPASESSSETPARSTPTSACSVLDDSSLSMAKLPPLKSVAFETPKLGWIGGDGLILQTADGGITWSTIYSDPNAPSVTEVQPLGPGDGWALVNGVPRHLLAGHAEWTQAAASHEFGTISFLSDTVGFGISDGALYETSDGGSSWTPQTDVARPLAYSKPMRHETPIDHRRGPASGSPCGPGRT